MNLLEFKCNTFNRQFQAEYEFKIQMLAGKEAKTYFERFFKNLLYLGTYLQCHLVGKILNSSSKARCSLLILWLYRSTSEWKKIWHFLQYHSEAPVLSMYPFKWGNFSISDFLKSHLVIICDFRRSGFRLVKPHLSHCCLIFFGDLIISSLWK